MHNHLGIAIRLQTLKIGRTTDESDENWADSSNFKIRCLPRDSRIPFESQDWKPISLSSSLRKTLASIHVWFPQFYAGTYSGTQSSSITTIHRCPQRLHHPPSPSRPSPLPISAL